MEKRFKVYGLALLIGMLGIGFFLGHSTARVTPVVVILRETSVPTQVQCWPSKVLIDLRWEGFNMYYGENQGGGPRVTCGTLEPLVFDLHVLIGDYWYWLSKHHYQGFTLSIEHIYTGNITGAKG